jgi:hypothetical protein
MKYELMLQLADLSLEPFMTAETKKEALHKARYIAQRGVLTDVVWVHVYSVATGLGVASFQMIKPKLT